MPYYVTNDNVKIYYEVKSNGKPLILIHGYSGNRHFFRKQTPVLVHKYKVIYYDLRGHGDSDKPEHGLYIERFAQDLKELIDL